MFDVTVVIVLGHYEPHPYKAANLNVVYPVCRAETDTDVKNKRMDAKRGKWRGVGWWDELGDWD